MKKIRKTNPRWAHGAYAGRRYRRQPCCRAVAAATSPCRLSRTRGAGSALPPLEKTRIHAIVVLVSEKTRICRRPCACTLAPRPRAYSVGGEASDLRRCCRRGPGSMSLPSSCRPRVGEDPDQPTSSWARGPTAAAASWVREALPPRFSCRRSRVRCQCGRRPALRREGGDVRGVATAAKDETARTATLWAGGRAGVWVTP